MDLKFIAVSLFYIELAFIIFILLLIICFRIIHSIGDNQKAENIKKLKQLLLDCITHKVPFDFEKNNPEKIVSHQDLLLIMESMNKSIISKEFTELKNEIFQRYLIEPARKLATSSSLQDRNYAARCFLLSSEIRDQSTIINLIDDPFFLVNSIAATAAVKLDLKEGILKIIKRMEHASEYLKCTYEDILMNGSEQLFHWIAERTALEEDSGIQITCLELLSSKEIIIPYPALRKYIYSDDPLIRLAAAKLFANNLQQDSEAVLLHLMDDPSEAVRALAAYGLGYFNSNKSIQRLTLALKEEFLSIRLQAAESLKRMGKIGLDVLNNYKIDMDKKAYETIQYVLEFNR